MARPGSGLNDFIFIICFALTERCEYVSNVRDYSRFIVNESGRGKEGLLAHPNHYRPIECNNSAYRKDVTAIKDERILISTFILSISACLLVLYLQSEVSPVSREEKLR